MGRNVRPVMRDSLPRKGCEAGYFMSCCSWVEPIIGCYVGVIPVGWSNLNLGCETSVENVARGMQVARQWRVGRRGYGAAKLQNG